MLKLVDIRKSFKVGPVTLDVLNGADMAVERSDMLSIVGTSGSGKSTLMNIIGLLDKPTSGAYYLEDEEVSRLDDRRLSAIRNRRIGFVFQQFNLISRLTALDNVGLPLVYRGASRKARDQAAMEVLTKVGLEDRVHHRPVALSGGQQQRVAIARAMVGHPSIILADEPTGALDPKVGQEIMSLFSHLNRTDGITIIIITHDIGVARQCHRILRMADGVLIEERKDP